MVSYQNRSKKGQKKNQPLRPHCRKQPGIVALTYLFNNYRSNAKRRGYTFTFLREEFAAIIAKNCFYCDGPPLSLAKRDYDSILYNGIDRLDNSHGYVQGNCVACCRRCNMMKGTMSVQEFFEAIKIIHAKKILASGDELRGRDSTLKTQEFLQ